MRRAAPTRAWYVRALGSTGPPALVMRLKKTSLVENGHVMVREETFECECADGLHCGRLSTVRGDVVTLGGWDHCDPGLHADLCGRWNMDGESKTQQYMLVFQ